MRYVTSGGARFLSRGCRGAGLAVGLGIVVALIACAPAGEAPPAPVVPPGATVIQPVLVTQPVAVDSDDPAIWLHPDDPSKSMVLGTDKGGGLYAFDLDGNIIDDRSVTDMGRVNNVDVEYGMMLGGAPTDIAVATDRNANSLRVFRLPEMTPIDGGGLPMFEGQPPELRRPMGIALYKRPADGAVFAIVSRKTGPAEGYLWQYLLSDDGAGTVTATKVREFGAFKGTKEIESVAVDDPLGYVYYSEEDVGVHKYFADPDAPDAARELALFGTEGFTEQREGISIYEIDDGTGYIMVSDQQGNAFRVYPREGTAGDPNRHPEIGVFSVSTNESDGSDVTSTALGERFPSGLFVAMSDNRTFQYYSWADIDANTQWEAPTGPAEQ